MSDDILQSTNIEVVYERLSGYSLSRFMRFGSSRLVHCISEQHPVKFTTRDAHPSCSINTDKNTWRCFSCGGKGGMLGLVIAAGKAENPAGAIRWLRSGTSEAPQQVFALPKRYGGVSAVFQDEVEAASYPYCEADGELGYKVIRKEGYDSQGLWSKRFLQCRPYRGAWIWHLGKTCDKRKHPNCPCHWPGAADARVSTRMLPYRLPEVLVARAAGRTIFLAEGEKCADKLRELGLCATTPSGGVNASLRVQSEPLPPISTLGEIWEESLTDTALLVCMPDCDRIGRMAAAAHYTRLLPYVKRAVVLDLDPARGDSYDVADWISEQRRHGMSRDDIVEAVRTKIRTALHERARAA